MHGIRSVQTQHRGWSTPEDVQWPGEIVPGAVRGGVLVLE
jgi:hypothetical protein